MTPDELPVSVQFLQLITAKWVVKPMYVAAKLKLADHIKSGVTDVASLAEKTGTKADMLYRLLRALSSVGIFHEGEGQNFTLTPLAECLLDEPGSPRDMLLFVNDPVHDRAWDHLHYCLETGNVGFEKAHGAGIFDYCKTDLDFSEVFNRAMSSNGQAVHSATASVLDISSVDTLYDIGGGHGHLIKFLMDKAPSLKGGVFDLPHVVAGAEDAKYPDLKIMAGSFFEDIPKGADAHILSFIIHDWDDENAVKILQKCYQALPAGGQLFICDAIINEPNAPNLGKLLDIEMIVMTTGKERTVDEFKTLIEASGFTFEGIVDTPGPHSVICGRK